MLLTDVKEAIPYVAKGNLTRRMEDMEFEANLVRWVESFKEARKVIMSMDGEEGDRMEVETEVAQGSPVSLDFFIICLSGSFSIVEEKKEECGSAGISFVDDVVGVVEGVNVGECTQRLEIWAAEAQKWAKENTCQFDIKKTEVILFTRSRSNKELKMKANIRIGNDQVQCNQEATR